LDASLPPPLAAAATLVVDATSSLKLVYDDALALPPPLPPWCSLKDAALPVRYGTAGVVS
jgi:hypothetical protein